VEDGAGHMQCRRCQVHNRDGALFCRECGARLESVCPACGATFEPGSRFCEACGAALGMPAASPGGLSCFGISGPDSLQSLTPKHLAEKILASRRALEGERKRVTVLFCDIVGSTALAERLGEEPMHALINQFFVLTLAEVHRYEGTLSHFLGDGFMALFGAPVAHEDHARRAVLAALAIQRSIKAAAGRHRLVAACRVIGPDRPEQRPRGRGKHR